MKTDERFIFLIGQARSRLFARLDQALVNAAGITAAQSGALYYLMANDGCLLSELSRALTLDKPAVTVLVDRLEARGLVKRRSILSDRRDVGIFLTEPGREAAGKCLGVIKKFNDAVKERLSQDEIDVLSRALQKIIRQFS